MAEQEKTSLGQSIATGAAWLVFLRVVIKAIGIVSTLIIARLLLPEDFGLYALSMSVFSFVELIRAFGFGMALIQNQQATEEHYSTAWTLHFTFSFLAAGILFVLASPISHWINEPRTLEVIQFLSLVFIFDAFTNIGVIDFQKKMQFHKEFIRQVLIKLGGFVVTIPLVFILRDYWALLYGTLATTLVSVVLSYTMHPFRPKFSLKHYKEMLKFSTWLQLNNVLRYADKNLVNFLVSRFSGAAGVGLLAMSKEISATPIVELVEPINRAAYPAFSRIISDQSGMKHTFFGVYGSIAAVSLPVGAGIAVLAPAFVPTLLGEQWFDTIVLIQILSLAYMFSALNSSISYVFLAAAKQVFNFYLILAKLLLFVPLMVVLIPDYGAAGAAASLLITSILMFPITALALGRVIGFGVNEFINPLLRPLLSMLAMVLAVQFALGEIQAAEASMIGIIGMLLLILVGMLTYLVTIVPLWIVQSKPEGAEANLLRLVENRVELPIWLSPRKMPNA